MLTWSNFGVYFKRLNAIYMILLFTFLLCMTLSYVWAGKHSLQVNDDQIIFFYLDIVMGLLLYLFSGFIKKLLSKKTFKITNFRLKLIYFSRFFFLNLMLIFIYGLINIIIFSSTANLLFMFFAAYALLLILLMKQKIEKLSFLVHINNEEQYFISHPGVSFD